MMQMKGTDIAATGAAASTSTTILPLGEVSDTDRKVQNHRPSMTSSSSSTSTSSFTNRIGKLKNINTNISGNNSQYRGDHRRPTEDGDFHDNNDDDDAWADGSDDEEVVAALAMGGRGGVGGGSGGSLTKLSLNNNGNEGLSDRNVHTDSSSHSRQQPHRSSSSGSSIPSNLTGSIVASPTATTPNTITNSRTSIATVQPLAPPTPPPKRSGSIGSIGWSSFNPFSIIAPSPKSTTINLPASLVEDEKRDDGGDNDDDDDEPPPIMAGPEAVAALLSGQPIPTTVNRVRPTVTKGKSTSSSSSITTTLSNSRTTPNVIVRQSSFSSSGPPRSRTNTGDVVQKSGLQGGSVKSSELEQDSDEDQAKGNIQQHDKLPYSIEQCKASVKSNVEEIVKDPVSLVWRLMDKSNTSKTSSNSSNPRTPLSPPTPSSPSQSEDASHRDSISSVQDDTPPKKIVRKQSNIAFRGGSKGRDGHSFGEGNESDDEDDDDPAAGYVQLNATNLSSDEPTVVEYGKEEEETAEQGRERRRRKKFEEVLCAENVDLPELRKLAWAGIPDDLRPMSWQLLLGYLPAPASRRLTTLARKRQEYADAVRLAFSRGEQGLDGPIWHQISIDIPRTHAGVRLYQCEGTQKSLERILYVWAIRHPASGYVQGINDLVTPFFQVFLSSYIDSDPENYDVLALPAGVLEALEADSFWCLSKLLDGIQDNYIFAQPGITRQVTRMKELCSRVDAPLAHHLEEHNVEFIQFAFRWMNCLLMRELSVKNIVRMWDTYLAEGTDAFSEFHLYVCLAFLVKWSNELREMDFQSIIMYLQSLPTQGWSDKDTELLLSEAFMWSRTFKAR